MNQEPRSERVRAALFDLDGTLVHSHIDFRRMRTDILAAAERHGVNPAPLAHLDVLTAIRQAAPLAVKPEAFLREAEELLVAIELAACERVEEAAGATEILHWLLDRGVRVGIVTRNSPQAVRRTLEQIPLPHEVLLTRADTPRVKPDPLHLTLALQRLGVAARNAVMVGDHTMDVQGGRAAGMRTVGVLLPDRPSDFFHEVAPDLVIRSLPELQSWISPS